MPVDRRRANEPWEPADEKGTITWDRVDTALLMDLRDELQKLNRLLHCTNFIEIPRTLRTIARKMPPQRRRPKKSA